MKILVTGSNGFVGQNLMWNLKNRRNEMRSGQNRPGPDITEIYGYDQDSDQEALAYACERADFVFSLAGVNRPQKQDEYMQGNAGFAGTLLEMLEKYDNRCPVMYASSLQASLTGRFGNSAYGRSKLAGEELFFQHRERTGAKVLVYRFPNLFGKWCRPDYNSVVATFCNAVANDCAYTVHDTDTELELLYIDDLVSEMLLALEGKEHRCEYKGLEVIPRQEGRFCYVPGTYHVRLGRIVELLRLFDSMPRTLLLPEIADGSFEKKLYSVYMSYLPESKISYPFHSNTDSRGNFTELIRTSGCGQVSIHITKPGITRGGHWHNSKWEIFIVVSGHGRIQERRIGINPETGRPYPVMEFDVTGARIQAVQMLPGYTHSITNLSGTEDLVTVIWANEPFDKNRPDTFYEPVAAEE